MELLGGKDGSKVKGRNGKWNAGDYFGDNAQMFNDDVKANWKPEMGALGSNPPSPALQELFRNAAKNTWTGKQAAKHGFTEVTMEKFIWDAENQIYQAVKVGFTRGK